jgi:dipeptidyl aminopeptidase/acylaminoacyl peptidase
MFASDFPQNRTLHVTNVSSGRTRPIDPEFDRQSAGDLFSGASNPRWLDNKSVAAIAQDHGTASPIVSTEGAGTRWVGRGKRVAVSLSVADDGRTAAVVASTLSRPAEVHVLDLTTGGLRQRTRLNTTWLEAVQTSEAAHHTVATAAGVEVDYWIMEPAGRRAGRKYPVLLNVHGGPFGQYGEDFFDEFQVFAAAGYGVVFCNPRGSSGQSSEFARAIVGNLGGPDFDDVMAAFEAALERMPWADQSRLGIIGGSYAACSERAVNDWYLMHRLLVQQALSRRAREHLRGLARRAAPIAVDLRQRDADPGVDPALGERPALPDVTGGAPLRVA